MLRTFFTATGRGILFRSRGFATLAPQDAIKVCVVGAGPSGFYTTKYLLKDLPNASVDLMEALPTPFGLVRYGVAPDHPEVKSVQNDFTSVAQDPRVRFLGNVNVGEALSVDDLRALYDVVVLSYGASNDRALGLPNEYDLKNVYSAREFVNWYNGHPAYSSLQPDLSCDTAVVVGHGNVALDCARVLTRPIDQLASTDITQGSLDALKQSKITKVVVMGRRGHVQSSFTMKEIRELFKLEDVGLLVRAEELDLGSTDASMAEVKSLRPKKRMNEFLRKVSENYEEQASKPRQIELRFLTSPVELIASSEHPDKIGGLVFEKTKLEGEAGSQSAKGTGERDIIPCGLVLKSIGYKSQALPGVPFDDARGVILNDNGRVKGVQDGGNAYETGLYTCGWVKRGPSGIIGTNIIDARDTIASIMEDVSADLLSSAVRRNEDVATLLPDHVDWKQYSRLDEYENNAGLVLEPAKPREKVTSVQSMLDIARKE